MQTLPTTAAGAAGFFGALASDLKADGDFLSSMNDAFAAIENGESDTVRSALDDSGAAPLVESPYTRHTTDGITYTLDEVCFTRTELEELRQELLKAGAPEESLNRLDMLIDQPAGATLAQVIASLTGSSGTMILGDREEKDITALLGQIDPSGKLASDVLDAMRAGNPMGALDLIQASFSQLGANERIEIDAEQMLSLARGLGLNRDSLNQIGRFFQSSSLSLNAAQFDALMGPAKNQFLADAANSQKLSAALEQTLKPLISKARNRMEKEKAANELQDRRVAQSKVLIDRTVQQNSRDMLDETLTGQSKGEIRPDALKRGKSDAIQDGDNLQKGQLAAEVLLPEIENDFYDAGHDADFQGFSFQKDSSSRSDAWKEFLSHVEARPARALFGSSQPSAVYTSMFQTAAEPEILASQALLQNEPVFSSALAGQVAQGMLMAMQNGSTRLDLQLHPAELGAISITLIARNGEVTAKLISEKGETADMLSREIDAIRINLEQQGVRVDKIEVQLENRGENNGDVFADLGQHNARQEENARRQELNRLRNLANIRNNTENSDETVLAQDVHDIAQTARYAGQSMHVVA